MKLFFDDQNQYRNIAAIFATVFPFAMLLLTSGCSIGPNYVQPELPAALNFIEADPANTSNQTESGPWWRGFNDQTLNTLIFEAVRNNKNLDAALARLSQSRALRSQSQFDFFPTVRAESGYTTTLVSEADRPQASYNERQFGRYDGSFSTFWELDLFGRVRRSVEATSGEEQAAFADLQSALVSVVAEVADGYLTLRGLQRQLKVATSNASNQEESSKLTEALLNGGRASGLDTARAKAQWKTTLATVPPLEAQIASAKFRLAVLLGKTPAEIAPLLGASSSSKPSSELPKFEGPLQITDPQVMLRRRPDIRAAERRLAAATARIGVATGELFPKLTLVGNIGYSGDTLATWTDGDAGAYGLGPRLSWAAFDLGRVRAQVRAANAQASESLASYELSVLRALEETESALARFRTERSRARILWDAVEESGKAADLARTQFNDGLVDFLVVIEAQRVKLEAESAFVQSQTQVLLSAVQAYRALGAGWEEFQILDLPQSAAEGSTADNSAADNSTASAGAEN